WSFHPREILTFVIPSMFGFGGSTYWGSMPFTDYPNYMGIVALALAIYGALSWRGGVRWYLLALAGFALLMSFGKHFQPLYSLLYYHLPFFNKFRVPVMVLVLVQFATAALAAFGLTRALERPATAKEKDRDPGAPWIRAAWISAASGIAVVALLHAASGALVSGATRARPHFTADLARQALDMASLDAIKSGLLLGLGLLFIGFARRGKIRRTAAAIAALADTAGIMSSMEMLRFLNVKYVLLDGKLPPSTPGVVLRHEGDINVYEIEGVLPRAYVVHRLKPVRDDAVALATIRTNGFNPA